VFPSRWMIAVLVLATACARPTAPLPDVPRPAPTPPPALVLPGDAGPHDALTEWWYYTGHLRSDADGRAYGFEYTVFQVRRQGAPTGYLVHFAVSDIAGQHFSHQARFRQGEAAAAFPLDVDGWRLGTDGSSDSIAAAMVAGPGAEVPFGLRLELSDEKPPALHHGGYIDYGPAGGSYYYSRTRLSVSGELTQGGLASVPVSGVAWMDHQWGNFVVTAAGGWDWYSLQLDDRSELMLYVLRGANGETTGVYGTQVLADGSSRDLRPGSVTTEATGTWTSPHTGAVYPSGWQLTLSDGERLALSPQLVDQELYFPAAGGQGSGVSAQGSEGATPATVSDSRKVASEAIGSVMAYWEGAVSVTGDRTGVGYVELTGYAAR
jgi:predicted secreted hydrolase